MAVNVCSMNNFLIHFIIILFLFIIIQLSLVYDLAIEIYGYSPSFLEEEIRDGLNDHINMSTQSVTNNGYKPTDITSVDYFSDGKTLNATLWLLFPFQKTPNLSEVDYGMFIDADFNRETGFNGIDYKIELQWEKMSHSWSYVIESWSLYGETKELMKVPNYTNFYNEEEKHVTLSVNLEKILSPQKYQVLFYADSRENDEGILIMDLTRWVAIPPLKLGVSTNPKFIEIEQGSKENLEVIINATYDEPLVNLYTTNQSKDIDFEFETSKLRIPSYGETSTLLSIDISEFAKVGPRTLFIFANSSFPPDELIKPAVENSTDFFSSVPTENIIERASISLKVIEPPDLITQLGQSWEKIGGFTQFIYGIILGISPWLYDRIRHSGKKKHENSDSNSQRKSAV